MSLVDVLKKATGQDVDDALKSGILKDAIAPTPEPSALPVATTPEALPAPNVAIPPPTSLPPTLASAVPSPDVAPKLAEQGPSNPILHAIARVTGAVGDQPAPGQEYTGPITGKDKIGNVSNFISKLAGGVVQAAGTPAQQEADRAREATEATVPLKLAQLKAADEYHKATVGERATYHAGVNENKSTANDIAQQKADTSQDRLTAQMRAKGYLPDETNPNSFREMTAEELAKDPVLSSNHDLILAKSGLENAQNELARARAQVLLHPEQNAKFAQHEREIQAKMRLAEMGLAIQQRRLNQSNLKMLYDYGANETGDVLSNENAAPFMTTDAQGNAIPNKAAGPFRPTTGARTKGEQATTIVDAGEKLVQHIKDNAALIGPVASRYNSLEQFIGNPPPEYKGLAAELESWIALHPAAHGFRGMNAVQEFQKAFGPIAMTPEALIAGIRGSYNTMGALERTATPKTTGPKQSGGGPKPTNSSSSSNSGVVEYVRDANGKIVPKKK